MPTVRSEPIWPGSQFWQGAAKWAGEVDALGAGQRKPRSLLPVGVEDDVCRHRPDLTPGVENPGPADPVDP